VDLQTRELNEIESKATFGSKMLDVTETATDVIDIWAYVKSVPLVDLEGHKIFDNLVENVYTDEGNRFDHVLVMTKTKNVYLVIIVDLVKGSIYGHRLLDLNKEYGILNAE